jgi:hypothetical protein
VYNRSIDIYTFVPEEYPQEKLVLQSCRVVNECLGLFRESIMFDDSYPFAAVAVSYDMGNNISTFVSTKKQYYILLYLDFLNKLEQKVSIYELDERCVVIENMRGNAYVHQKLMKYALFFITLHEYAHILNGDCDKIVENEPVEDRNKKERLADKFADENLDKVLPLQYRELSLREVLIYKMEDDVLAMEARKIAISMRNL